MQYLSRAVVTRLRNPEFRSLQPGVSDLQAAIRLHRSNPDLPPVPAAELSALGIRENSMGLLDENNLTMDDSDDLANLDPGNAGTTESPDVPIPSAGISHPELAAHDPQSKMIVQDLFQRLGVNDSVDGVLAAKSLISYDIYQWWKEKLFPLQLDTGTKSLKDWAISEAKRFNDHHGDESDSYQYSLFQQLAEIDPCLWLLQSVFWSHKELFAFQQPAILPPVEGAILPAIHGLPLARMVQRFRLKGFNTAALC
ncbi:hypothetical protein BJX99DRAFT_241599 [Aspergillus californicus]